MEISEKQLEDMICLENRFELVTRGLEVFDHDHLFRQYNLGSYGIIDLVGISATTQFGYLEVFVTIYELKKDEIGMSALGQICRYKKAFEDHFQDAGISQFEVRTVLIGSQIEASSNFVYVASQIDLLHCYTYEIGIKGLSFTEHELSDFHPGSLEQRGYGKLEHTDFYLFVKKSQNLIAE